LPGSPEPRDSLSRLDSAQLSAIPRSRMQGRRFWLDPPGMYRFQVSKARLLGCIAHAFGDVLCHLRGVLVKRGVVLDNDQSIAASLRRS
jgi:hypothetical protein